MLFRSRKEGRAPSRRASTGAEEREASKRKAEEALGSSIPQGKPGPGRPRTRSPPSPTSKKQKKAKAPPQEKPPKQGKHKTKKRGRPRKEA